MINDTLEKLIKEINILKKENLALTDENKVLKGIIAGIKIEYGGHLPDVKTAKLIAKAFDRTVEEMF